jgi:hypothetical protein
MSRDDVEDLRVWMTVHGNTGAGGKIHLEDG